MELTLDWRDDPLVAIEQAVVPVLVTAPTLLCWIAIGKREPEKLINWLKSSEALGRLLLTAFDERLVPDGLALTNGDRIVCYRAGRALLDFSRALGQLEAGDQSATSRALYRFESAVVPKVNAAFDVVTRLLIRASRERAVQNALALNAALSEAEDARETRTHLSPSDRPRMKGQAIEFGR